MKVTLLEGDELLEYTAFLPETVMEDDVEYGGLLYFGLDVDGFPAGLAVLRDEGARVTLRYLFLLPQYRHCGLGRRFVSELFPFFYEDAQEITAEITPKTRPEAAALLESLGFQKESNGFGSFRFTVSELENCEILGGSTPDVIPLAKAPAKAIENLWMGLQKLGKDLAPSPLESRRYHPTLSSVRIRDGICCAVLLASVEPGSVHVDYLFSAEKNPNTLTQLLSYLYQGGQSVLSPDTVVSFDVVEPRLFKMLKQILNVRPLVQYRYTCSFKRFRERMVFALGWMQDFERQSELLIV